MSGNPAPARAAVIGAGFAGLAAALRLAEAGVRVCLLESSQRLGGRASSFRDPRSGADLDWGPHLFMAANPALRSFLARAGAAPELRFPPSLDVTYRLADASSPGGGSRAVRLAFPPKGGRLGQAAALLRWPGPGLGTRLGIAWGLSRLLQREMGEASVAGLLDSLGQGKAHRAWFWEPFARAVLNLPLEEGSAALFARVVRESFGAGPEGAALAVPPAPLGAFWADRAGEAIEGRGGEVRRGRAVRGIAVEGGAVRGLRLAEGEFLETSCVISAVPPPALLGFLPVDCRRAPPFGGLERLRPSPIASAYLWLDGPCPGAPFE
ncbi:MAG: FAD-dependent oxidoreductase, partial [Nitrospinota bacterium]